MNGNKLKITEFKLTSMTGDPAIVLVAARNSGKSYIIRDIMYTLRHKPAGAVISPTDRLSSFYKNFFPDIYIHYDINQSIFTKILTRQFLIEQKQKNKERQGLKIDTSAILVMDDCLSDKKKWAKMQEIAEILLNGRHYHLTYILTMQNPTGIPPELRLNFEFIFLLKEKSSLNIKKIYENYASMFPTRDIFEQAFKSCTENYSCMVINNRISGDFTESTFWFKAKERKFTFGSEQFKAKHKKYYDKNHAYRRSAKMLLGDGLLGKKKNDFILNIEKI